MKRIPEKELLRLRKVVYGGNCTYFPMENRWLVFTSNNKSIGEFERSSTVAIDKAIKIRRLELDITKSSI